MWKVQGFLSKCWNEGKKLTNIKNIRTGTSGGMSPEGFQAAEGFCQFQLNSSVNYKGICRRRISASGRGNSFCKITY
jgi:hypothetical protein